MQIQVLTDDGRPVAEGFLVRLGGWTEERYLAEAPEDRLCEFQDGELIVHSPATPAHQRTVRFLTFLLTGFVEERRLGEVLNGPAVMRLGPGANREPDIFFVREDRRAIIGPTNVEGAADFIIEIISAGTRTYDLSEKAGAYRDAGVAEYWAIDRERRDCITHRLDRSEYRIAVLQKGRLESTAVPGFWIDIGWLWTDPLPSGPACLARILRRPD